MVEMIKFKNPILLILFLLVVSAVSLSISTVSAQTAVLSDAQINSIKANCTPAKNILSQLHANDALLRVNRGQIYDSMSTKLMTRFDNRVSGAGFNTLYLSQAMSDYVSALNDFRQSYRSYEEKLSKTIDIDCNKDPTGFYQSLMDARYNRTELHTSVTKLNQKMNDYGSAVSDFKSSFFGEVKV